MIKIFALVVLAHVVRSYVTALRWCVETGSPSFGAFFSQAVILDVDWDAVFAITLGIGALGMVVLEHRRTTKLDDLAQDMGERIAKIEVIVAGDAPHTLAERVAALEATIERIEDKPDTSAAIADLRERLGVVEEQPDLREDIIALRERVAVVEARIDFKPITHTRNARGKFVSPGSATTCEDPK